MLKSLLTEGKTLNGDSDAAAQSISVPEGALNGEAVKFVEKILEQSAVAAAADSGDRFSSLPPFIVMHCHLIPQEICKYLSTTLRGDLLWKLKS